jgi:hypothetical protein
MKKIYLASGYNSWTNNTIYRVFNTLSEANGYLIGLTDGNIDTFSANTMLEAFNRLIAHKLAPNTTFLKGA